MAAMEIILDKGFLAGFFKHNSTVEKRAVYDSFIRFVKNLRTGVKLTCDFQSHDELEYFIIHNPLLNEIEDRSPEYNLVPDLHKKLDQKSFYEEGSSFKLFFLENSEDHDRFEGLFGYSYISGSMLSIKWKRFLTNKEITRYFITTNPGIHSEDKFDSWAKLRDYRHPVNAIVIADKYILCDKYEQKINSNLKPLLLELIANNKNLLAVDVTIIAEQSKCKRTFEELKEDLEKFLEEKRPNTKVNLTLIDLDDKVKAYLENTHGTDFHDRRIVTSYYWYEVGRGFNLFKNARELKPTNSRMYLGFNFYASNQVDARLLLEEYATCASVATQVYGSNKNRLLSQYQTTCNTKPQMPSAAIA